MQRTIGIVVAIAAACGGAPGQDRPAPAGAAAAERELASLRAFAQLYGVVRWFHPSDEAAAIDWDRYAVAGVREVRAARDPAALQRALAAWVAPVGPSVQVAGPGQALAAHAADPAAPQVAWQHLGPGFDGGGSGAYQSRRTHRTGIAIEGGRMAALVQRIDAAALRGQRVRLHVQLRAGARSRVQGWLRVDRAGGMGHFDDMADRPVTAERWTRVTLEGPVADDATVVVIGGLVKGGEGWFDGFTLEAGDGRGAWRPVAVANPELDDGTTGWTTTAFSHGFELAASAGARDGGPAAKLTVKRVELTEDLFPERPAPGEVMDVELGGGLRARVPLSLASPGDHTVPAGDLAAARARTDAIAELSAGDADVRLADVIVAWSMLAHFYPYHDVIGRPWPLALDRALAEALAARTPAQHGGTLRHLIAALDDGHGRVNTAERRADLPLRLGLVEGRVAVLASSAPELERGDVLVEIDGVAAAAALDAARARTSGSPQWRTHVALRDLGEGAPESTARVVVERAGQRRTVAIARGTDAPALFTYPPVGEVRPGVWLIDLSRAEMKEIDERMATLAAARGVVFDLRGYPKGTHGILNHLVPAPEEARWMHLAHVIRPNLPGAAPPQWTSVGWGLQPEAPRLAGKVVFLTGPGAISYAESVMGYVEALKLPIVGAATAGTNGNVRVVALPSGAEVVFTGMKVTRHDGSRSHLEGIRPTVPVEPTLAGVRAGRDEVLERALALIAGS